MTQVGDATESFTIDIPLARLVRVLHDPQTLAAMLTRAEAEATIADLLVATCDPTIMFGDIAGFTPMMERVGDQAAADLLTHHDHLVQATVSAHGGHRVSSAGDGFLAVFDLPVDALRSAVRIQRALEADVAVVAGVRVRSRLGVHTGPVVATRSVSGAPDLAGRSVVVASRISDAAAGGQVLVSAAVRRATEPCGEFAFGRTRALRLKGLAGRHRVAELAWRRSLTEHSHRRRNP